METLNEYREWLIHRIKQLTVWSKPSIETDIPNGMEVIEVDEEWPGPDLNIYEDAAEIVLEAGEYALLFGLPDLYRATRVRCPGFPLPMMAIDNAKERLGQCLAAVNELIAKGVSAAPTTALPPEAVPSQEESAKLARIEQMTREEKQALAVGLLVKHPDWSATRIAEYVGVDRRTLYHWAGFQTAWRAARAKDRQAIPRGSKSKDRTVEAYSTVTDGAAQAYTSPDDCEACGDPGGVHELNGKYYCRDCYLEKVKEDQEADDARYR